MESTLFDGSLVKSNRIIYTASDFAKANLMHLQEVGELRAQKPHVSRRKDLLSYLFFMVEEGEGTLEYDGKSYALTEGDCVWIDCRRPYAHCCSEQLWRLKWVHFYGPNLSGIYRKYAERGGRPIIHSADRQTYGLLLDEIYAIAASDSFVRDMQLYEKLAALLTRLMEQSWNADRDAAGGKFTQADTDAKKSGRSLGKRQNLQDIKEYLDANFNAKITLDDLAEKFFINKFYLTRVFKEQFGESVTEYLIQVRITHAKHKLRFTDETMETIAGECGMSDPNYFSRVFKRVEGVTPGEYRRMW